MVIAFLQRKHPSKTFVVLEGCCYFNASSANSHEARCSLRLHRVYNISNTVFEIFRARCLKYYAGGEKKKRLFHRTSPFHPSLKNIGTSTTNMVKVPMLIKMPERLFHNVFLAIFHIDARSQAIHAFCLCLHQFSAQVIDVALVCCWACHLLNG